VEREVLQDPGSPVDEPGVDDAVIDDTLVYSNRTAWHPQGAQDDHARVVLRMETPANQTAVTGGERVAGETSQGRARVEYRQDLPAKYVTAVVGRLVEGERAEVEGVRVQLYTVPRARAAASALLAQSVDVLRFFTAEFGPCPYPLLNLTVIESRVPGGHSPPGMVVMSVRPPLFRRQLRDDPASFWEIPGFFLAHELAHQWWGHGVAGSNYRERWISEAMAQYAAALWTRRTHGEAKFREVMGKMARWALDRTDEGPIHLGHRLGHIKADPQTYRAVVYDKGAYVLHMLRGIVGESAFRGALTRLQREKRFAKASSDDLRTALERESGRDLRPYFDAWVYGVRVPRLVVTKRYEPGAVQVDVAAEDVPGDLPLSVDVVHDGGRESTTVTLRPGGGSFRVPARGRVRRVEVNADRALLARITNR
jgi:aminopeptidase N